MKRLKTAALFAALVLANSIQAASVVRIFEIQSDTAQQARFNRVGEANLTESVQTESGTLAMYAAHKTGDAAQNVVLEIYRDDNAYRIHRNSAQYRAYAQMAKEVVRGFKKFETDAQFLAEKPQALAVVNGQNSDVHVRLTAVSVKPGANAEFRRIVINEMQQAVDKEDGVWVMYALTLQNNPNEWRFFEIYANEAAYLQHRETPHFKQYLAATEKMITAKNGTVFTADTLMNKGGLRFNILDGKKQR